MGEREQCCPKCKGTSGYFFSLTTVHGMAACGWTADDEPEAGEGVRGSGGSGVSLFECMDCGHKLREATVLAIRYSNASRSHA